MFFIAKKKFIRIMKAIREELKAEDGVEIKTRRWNKDMSIAFSITLDKTLGKEEAKRTRKEIGIKALYETLDSWQWEKAYKLLTLKYMKFEKMSSWVLLEVLHPSNKDVLKGKLKKGAKL